MNGYQLIHGYVASTFLGPTTIHLDMTNPMVNKLLQFGLGKWPCLAQPLQMVSIPNGFKFVIVPFVFT